MPLNYLQQQGQLGPICAITGKAMTFAEAIVMDDHLYAGKHMLKLQVQIQHLKVRKYLISILID